MKRDRKILIVIGILSVLLLAVIINVAIGWAGTAPKPPALIKDYSPKGTVPQLNQTVTVAFTERMNTVSVEDAFSVTDGVTRILGTFTWYEDATFLEFIPVHNLADGKEYKVVIAGTAETTSGSQLGSDFTWKFYTPSTIRSVSAIMPIVLIPVLFLLAIFLFMEYSHYRMWTGKMVKRYGSEFREENYDFMPLFRRKKKIKKGMIILKGTWGAIYDNGVSAVFMYEKHKSIRHEFKSYSEIEAIYPFSMNRRYSGSKSMMYDGIQIETKDLKVCIFNATMHPLKEIMPDLVSELGERWDKIYKKDSPVEDKMMGVHHRLIDDIRRNDRKIVARKRDEDDAGNSGDLK